MELKLIIFNGISLFVKNWMFCILLLLRYLKYVCVCVYRQTHICISNDGGKN